jgi:hypothetical protein
LDPKVCLSQWSQGDACKLPADLGTFDAILAANLLCRVPDPQVRDTRPAVAMHKETTYCPYVEYIAKPRNINVRVRVCVCVWLCS